MGFNSGFKGLNSDFPKVGRTTDFFFLGVVPVFPPLPALAVIILILKSAKSRIPKIQIDMLCEYREASRAQSGGILV